MPLLFADITEKIIGCAMTVHRKMKNGYAEAVYQKCMEIELKKMCINFLQEADIGIYYENVLVGRRRVDFLIEEKIAVELKAVSDLTDAHLAQALNYLETNRLEVGLLINFGAKSLQFKRLINQHKLHDSHNPVNPIQNQINLRS
jgi:GxxExxY protein